MRLAGQKSAGSPLNLPLTHSVGLSAAPMRSDLSNDMKLAYTIDFANIARSLYCGSIAVQHFTAFGLPRLCFLVQKVAVASSNSCRSTVATCICWDTLRVVL